VPNARAPTDGALQELVTDEVTLNGAVAVDARTRLVQASDNIIENAKQEYLLLRMDNYYFANTDKQSDGRPYISVSKEK
jgi:hypothetical protein